MIAAAKTMEIAYTRKKSALIERAPPTIRVANTQLSAADTQKMMEQMMELAKPGENHKLLAQMVGSWIYTLKWTDPTGKPQESKGFHTRKAIMDGRFFLTDHVGRHPVPGADGTIQDKDVKDMGIEGYDNVKKKFVSVCFDNMGTGITLSNGTYDAGSRTFSYTGEYEAMPGAKIKTREMIKVADKDHHTLERYSDVGQGEIKSLEINYIRKK